MDGVYPGPRLLSDHLWGDHLRSAEGFPRLVTFVPGITAGWGDLPWPILAFMGNDLSVFHPIARADAVLVAAGSRPISRFDGRLLVVPGITGRSGYYYPFEALAAHSPALVPHPGRLDTALLFSVRRGCLLHFPDF